MADRLLEALMARQEQLRAAGLNVPDVPQAQAYAQGLGPGILGSIARIPGAIAGIPGHIAGQVNTLFQRPPAEPVNEQDYPAWEQAKGVQQQQQAEASFGVAGLPIAGAMPFAARGALGSAGGRLSAPRVPPPVPQWATPKVEPAGIFGYHASPHDFTRFDSSKIGTGEGPQTFGHGLYIAGNPKVSGGPGSHYYEQFAARMPEGTKPRTYEVSINADPEHFLHWNKPLSEQSAHVQEALKKLAGANPEVENVRKAIAAVEQQPASPSQQQRLATLKSDLDRATQGGLVYEHLARVPLGEQFKRGLLPRTFDPEAASKAYSEAGIPGIKYLDQGSRGVAGQPSHNYVVFNDSLIEIMRKYGIPGIIGGGGAAAALDQQQ